MQKHYVDGFVLVLPTKNVAAYRKIATVAAKVWCDHGALSYVECVGDDLESPCGVPFPKLAKCKRGETVVFAWITYASRKERDRINAAVMADPRLAKFATMKMPFDMKRLSHGGFRQIVAR